MKPLARWHSAAAYNALFRATSELLLELGRTRLKAILGLTLVLHTWTRDLRFHPHVHVLATAGGLSLDGKRFVHSRKDYLFPVEVKGTLHPVDFLSRFVQHVLPDGFHKIRHAGLYTSPSQLERARTLLPITTTKPAEPSGTEESSRCPHCGGLIQRIRLARAPPPEGPCI